MSTTLKVDCPYCREPMQLILLKTEDVRGGQRRQLGPSI